jgi:hypothetical protein
MKKTQLSLLIAALLTGANLYATEPAKETPQADAPKADAPKADAPKADAPKADAPKVDAPKVDVPKVDAPKVDAPKVDAPKVDAPKVDEPKVDAPQADAPKADKAIDLNGNWASTHGGDIITVEHKGDKFTATYEYADDSVMYVGKIEATVKDKAIEGTWSEKPKAGRGESSNGDVKFTIVDAKTLLGKWRSEDSRDWDDWNLEKK